MTTTTVSQSRTHKFFSNLVRTYPQFALAYIAGTALLALAFAGIGFVTAAPVFMIVLLFFGVIASVLAWERRERLGRGKNKRRR